ncbi:protein ASYMMETRIC LEAVES 2 [Camellia sinensis]|uniref:LOB domain-containing protein n=1 Tax=Camellia sinensis var. sinensis TaxID=542762 RepID=A0A4S4EWA5_CAMSN|nr:protein ASYMMETRIC LEAVES 2 [Camellia sinensis]THG21273.1 hypothetical protein TEA_028078 [Camellia sinensis var. sinensis]
MAMTSSSSSSNLPPCAACKFLRRKCLPECVFAPYFPAEHPQKFANVHKVFGASNVTKLLNELQPHQREDAVNSLAYEADMRLRDPVYGCVGVISLLQHQLLQLQIDLTCAKSELSKYHHHQNLGFTGGGGSSGDGDGGGSGGSLDHHHYHHHQFFPRSNNQQQHQEQVMRTRFDVGNNNVVYEYDVNSLFAMNVSPTASIGGQLNHQFQQQPRATVRAATASEDDWRKAIGPS